MIRSMTGYGSAERELPDGSLAVEIRSVNSRHLKLSIRLPAGGEPWEPGLRELAAGRLGRGHVDVRVEASSMHGEGAWELDEDRVEAYLEALDTLRDKYKLPGHADLSVLAALGELLRPRRREGLEWLAEAEVRDAAEEALAGLVEMREREGARLAEDLRARLAAIREGAGRIRELAPERLERERDRLRAAVEELADGVGLDDDRLAREIAVLAEKWDIGEEVVRTVSHLDAFEEYLEAPAGEPVGKRLAFLVQELHREINTMGAKANDTRITRHVVEMKNEVERLREQVENVE
jgi:uncharacterized protein (TIGR00255 family)